MSHLLGLHDDTRWGSCSLSSCFALSHPHFCDQNHKHECPWKLQGVLSLWLKNFSGTSKAESSDCSKISVIQREVTTYFSACRSLGPPHVPPHLCCGISISIIYRTTFPPCLIRGLDWKCLQQLFPLIVPDSDATKMFWICCQLNVKHRYVLYNRCQAV